MVSLIVAMLGFVGGHFLLSAPPVRRALVRRLGETAFLGVYSLIGAAFLAWVVVAWRAAPLVPLWDLGSAGRAIPLALMPVALCLLVAGLTTRSATAVGGERVLASGAGPQGIFTVTRHPFLWGTGLWSLAHVAANGDVAALVLFGGMAILSFGGMAAIDRKRRAANAVAWDGYAAYTSLAPFGAVLSGRAKVDWRGIGWVRPVAALVLYGALAHGHRWLFGMPAMG